MMLYANTNKAAQESGPTHKKEKEKKGVGWGGVGVKQNIKMHFANLHTICLAFNKLLFKVFNFRVQS